MPTWLSIILIISAAVIGYWGGVVRIASTCTTECLAERKIRGEF